MRQRDLRVLKPGGNCSASCPSCSRARLSAPLLQHDPPGPARLLRAQARNRPASGDPILNHPIWSLNWIVKSWSGGPCRGDARPQFLLSLRLRDLLTDPMQLLSENVVKQIPGGEELRTGERHDDVCAQAGRRKACALRSALKRDDFCSNRHLALGLWWSMVFSGGQQNSPMGSRTCFSGSCPGVGGTARPRPPMRRQHR